MSFENKIETYEILNAYLTQRKHREWVDIVDTWNPIDTAEYLETLTREWRIAAFRLLKKDTAADIFAELNFDAQETIISGIADREIAAIVEDLFVDDAVDLLEELPAGTVKRVLAAATPETRRLINHFLSYPENSAGSIMTAEYIDLKKTLTVERAVAQIRAEGIDKETVYVAYITNGARVLEGIVSLKDLLFASPDALLSDIMETDIVMALTTDDRETVADIISRYNLLALPIVDKEKRLVGIVTVDDAMDVIKEEATEDIEKMAAIVPDGKPYLKTSAFGIWKSRIPWLLLFMLSATITGEIISGFEAALALFPALVAFIPMLMNTGGNSGAQASATVIRGMSLGELDMKNIFHIIWKELRVGLLCGITLGACNFLKILLVDRLLLGHLVTNEQALAVSLALTATVVFAKLIGACLPMLAKSVRLDPTVVAGPFITTLVDALSLLVYFQIASVILGI